MIRVGLLLVFLASGALAHKNSNHEQYTFDQPAHVATAFVSALLSGYADDAEPLLDESFSTGTGGFTGPVKLDKSGFLERIVPTGVEISGIRLAQARLDIDGDNGLYGPLVIYLGNGDMAVMAMSLKLVRRPEGWRVSGLDYSAPVPDGVPLPPRPVEQVYQINVRVHDRDRSVGSRVSIVDDEGTHWVPDGKRRTVPTGWNQEVGAGVVIANRQYAYVTGEFTVTLPAGRYHWRIERGMEYPPLEKQIVINRPHQSVDIELRPWIDMNARGWRSGDTHIHFLDPVTALLEASGEGLNIANVLATQWGGMATNTEHFTGVPLVSPEKRHQVSVNEELRHSYLGHTVLLNLKKLVFPMSWGGPGEGVPGGYDFPLIGMQSDVVKAQGGFVAAAHLPLHAGELAADAALGKLDAVELMVWGNPFADYHKGPSASELYYTLLNAGIPMPAVAGTDKMMNLQTVGSVRTYAFTDGDTDYQAWIDAVDQGKTFVTTGPMLTLDVVQDGNRAVIGDTLTGTTQLSIKAVVESLIPVESLEIVSNGKVIAVMDNPSKAEKLVLEHQMEPGEGGWIAARTRSSKRLPYQTWGTLTPEGIELMAHTSPVYLKPGSAVWRNADALKTLRKRVEDALEWTRNQAHVRNETERESMRVFFEKAARQYDSWLERLP